jgi:hypothetical protein
VLSESFHLICPALKHALDGFVVNGGDAFGDDDVDVGGGGILANNVGVVTEPRRLFKCVKASFEQCLGCFK